ERLIVDGKEHVVTIGAQAREHEFKIAKGVACERRAPKKPARVAREAGQAENRGAGANGNVMSQWPAGGGGGAAGERVARREEDAEGHGREWRVGASRVESREEILFRSFLLYSLLSAPLLRNNALVAARGVAAVRPAGGTYCGTATEIRSKPGRRTASSPSM